MIQVLQNLQTMDSIKAEVLVRAFVGFVLGMLLVVLETPVTPTGMTFVIGILSGMYQFSFPHLMFGITQLVPAFLGILVLILMLAFMLCAAATVSDGLMVATYTVWCLIVMNLFTNNAYNMGTIFAGPLMAMSGMIASSLKTTVQKGGLPVLKELIVGSGLDNPSAFVYKIIVCFSWASLTYMVSLLIYPWRTKRDHVLIPQVLQAIRMITDDTGDFLTMKVPTNTTTPKQTDDQQTMNTSTKELNVPFMMQHLMRTLRSEDQNSGIASHQEVLRLWHSLNPVVDARVGSLEVRVLDGSFSNLQPQLLALLQATKELLMTSILLRVHALHEHTKIAREDDREEKAVDDIASQREDWEPLLKDIRTILTNTVTALEANGCMTDFVLPESLQETRPYPFYIEALLEDGRTFVRAAQVYSEIYYGGSDELLKDLSAVNFGEALLASLKNVLAPIVILKLSFRKGRYTVRSVLWATKWAAGFVLLFIMSVYWEEWNSFSIQTSPDWRISGIFKAWTLLGYAFSFQSTVEGTIKKGIMRVLGTIAGGFTAWIGIMLTSLSWDNAKEINPYGFVVYMSIMLTFALHTALPAGINARLQQEYDHGAFGSYFSTVLIVIATETYEGQADVNGLTVNRVVATISKFIAVTRPAWLCAWTMFILTCVLLRIGSLFQNCIIFYSRCCDSYYCGYYPTLYQREESPIYSGILS